LVFSVLEVVVVLAALLLLLQPTTVATQAIRNRAHRISFIVALLGKNVATQKTERFSPDRNRFRVDDRLQGWPERTPLDPGDDSNCHPEANPWHETHL